MTAFKPPRTTNATVHRRKAPAPPPGVTHGALTTVSYQNTGEIKAMTQMDELRKLLDGQGKTKQLLLMQCQKLFDEKDHHGLDELSTMMALLTQTDKFSNE